MNGEIEMPIEPWRRRHPLESPIWKIRRAEKHIEAINGYVNGWEALGPNRVASNLNRDHTFYELSIEARFPPVLDIGIALGEFAYQLRSALDQVVFAMSVFPENLKGRALEDAERTTSFPILSRRNDDVIWGRLKFVPERIKRRLGSDQRGTAAPARGSRGRR